MVMSHDEIRSTDGWHFAQEDLVHQLLDRNEIFKQYVTIV